MGGRTSGSPKRDGMDLQHLSISGKNLDLKGRCLQAEQEDAGTLELCNKAGYNVEGLE